LQVSAVSFFADFLYNKFNKQMDYITGDHLKTKQLGKILAENIKPQQKAAVFCLYGDLGAGKTTFLQGFGEGLGIKKIQSPTFVIMNKFLLKNNEFKFFYHFDCFRIEDPKEIINLGFVEIAEDPQNIVAIEWPEKIEKFLPTERIEIVFKIVDNQCRKIKIVDKK
jgi:tRNA threonylcarbamoyladenosine biosynthesis protein TsaE